MTWKSSRLWFRSVNDLLVKEQTLVTQRSLSDMADLRSLRASYGPTSSMIFNRI